MFRPSRSLTTWLLWLAIALLPVRAWAVAAMPVDMASTGQVASSAEDASADAAEPGPAALPCHGSGSSAPADDTEAPQACNLCGVCHAAFAGLPSTLTALPTLAPERPPGAFTPAVETAALAGPERPPRPVLA